MNAVSFDEWLNYDRARREYACKLDYALEKLTGMFSFVRLRGLRSLLELVDSVPKAPYPMAFLRLQDNEERFNIMYRILPMILCRKKFQPIVEITIEEKEIALNLVYSLCTLHPRSRKYFAATQYVDALVQYVRTDKLQIHALMALQAALVDARANQESFERLAGLRVVSNLLVNRAAPRDVRRQCAEFLYLFLSPDQDHDDSELSPMRSGLSPTSPTYQTFVQPLAKPQSLVVARAADPDGLTERGRNIAAYIGRDNLELLVNTIVIDPPTQADQSLELFLNELDESLDADDEMDEDEMALEQAVNASPDDE